MRQFVTDLWDRTKPHATRMLHKKHVRLGVIYCVLAVAVCTLVVAYASLFTGRGVHSPKTGSVATRKHAGQTPNNTTVNTESNGSDESQTPPNAIYPAQVLDLTNWKITLPISASNDNSPEEILQPRLGNFAIAPYFQLTNDASGVQFRAPTGGVTTSGSKYPRSELREMTAGGTKQASWSNANETHTMIIRQAITHLPAVKPQVVAGQIHDVKEYIILIRLEGSHLFVQSDDKNVGTLDDAYKLGTPFTVKIVAGGGRIAVFYNDAQKVDFAKSGSGYYFKAGCYTQSNPSKGDDPNDYGEVVIYSLQTS